MPKQNAEDHVWDLGVGAKYDGRSEVQLGHRSGLSAG